MYDFDPLEEEEEEAAVAAASAAAAHGVDWLNLSDESDVASSEIEDKFIFSKGLVKAGELNDALKGFREVVSTEVEKGKWGFKALKQIIKLQFNLRDPQQLVKACRDLLSYDGHVPTSRWGRCLQSLLGFVSKSTDNEMVQVFSSALLDGLEKTRHKFLWFKVQSNLCQMCIKFKDYEQARSICMELDKICRTAERSNDVTVKLQQADLQKLGQLLDQAKATENDYHDKKVESLDTILAEIWSWDIKCCWSSLAAGRAGHVECLQGMAQAGMLLPLDSPDRSLAGESRKREIWEVAIAGCRKEKEQVLAWVFRAGWPDTTITAADAESPWLLAHLWNDWAGKEQIWNLFGYIGWRNAGRPFLLELELYHAAVQCNTTKCLEELIDKGCRSRWLCILAVIEGKASFVRLIAERGCRCDLYALCFAARSGNPEVLQAVAALFPGGPLNKGPPSRCGPSHCFLYAAETAAALGHARCLLLLLDKFDGLGNYYSWSISYAAAAGGHVSCLEILHRRHCLHAYRAALAAAENGHLRCLQWAMRSRNLAPGRDLLEAASAAGSLECVQYLEFCWRGRERWRWYAHHATEPQVLAVGLKRLPRYAWDSVMESQVFSGQHHCMELMYSRGYQVGERQIYKAIIAMACCRLECLKVVVKYSGVPPRELLDMAVAAKAGEAMLRYVHELGGTIKFETALAAAEAGQAGALRYALNQGAPNHMGAIEAAFRGGSSECLQLLHEHPRMPQVAEHAAELDEEMNRWREKYWGRDLPRPTLEVLRYMCEHMDIKGTPEYMELLRKGARGLEERAFYGVDWQSVLYLARNLPGPLPGSLEAMAVVLKERAAALAHVFFWAEKQAERWGDSPMPWHRVWSGVARLPEALRERIAFEAHLCVNRGGMLKEGVAVPCFAPLPMIP
eukprot:jgi/Botrbrau1/22812/Bobra.0132s0136.1